MVFNWKPAHFLSLLIDTLLRDKPIINPSQKSIIDLSSLKSSCFFIINHDKNQNKPIINHDKPADFLLTSCLQKGAVFYRPGRWSEASSTRSRSVTGSKASRPHGFHGIFGWFSVGFLGGFNGDLMGFYGMLWWF